MSFNGSEHFSLKEIRCKDGTMPSDLTRVKMHLANMETFRKWYNKPMTINSWYRSPSYNKKVGGVKNSRHVVGDACDWSMPVEIRNASAERKAEWVHNVSQKWKAINGGKGGMGIYDTFVHLDSRPTYSRWDSRNKKNYKVVW